MRKNKALRKIYNGWIRMSKAISFVSSRIVLGVMYYTIFTIYRILLKLFSKDLLGLKEHDGSYWHKKDKEEDYSKPY